MKCERADILIMKYMDEEITEAEAKELNAHISMCPKCKESFMVFDSMLTQMEEIPHAVAPSGFEEAVMARIMVLPKTAKPLVYNKRDKMKMGFVGSFTLLLSLGAILITYRNAILTALMQRPYFEGAVRKLIPIVEVVEAHSLNAVGFLEQVVAGVDNVLSAGAGVFVTAIVALCGVQFVLARRKNR